jgi:CheY-like chemotaxis protein
MTPKTILYVEDSEVDAFFVKRTLEAMGVAAKLHVVDTGKEAVHYLTGAGRFIDRERYPLPAFVLLDLWLPGEQGFAVLEWIRQQPQYQSLPVVIFTASDLDADHREAQRLGANGYIVKPNDMSRLAALISGLLKRFLDTEKPAEDVPRRVAV